MDIALSIAPNKIDEIGYFAHAESLGYSTVWVTDTQMIWSDCFAVMALAAQQTKRIRLGAGTAVAGTRIAPVTANAIATINRLAPGRTVEMAGYLLVVLASFGLADSLASGSFYLSSPSPRPGRSCGRCFPVTPRGRRRMTTGPDRSGVHGPPREEPWMRRALRWWLDRPWPAFWIGVVALLLNPFLFGFPDALFPAPRLSGGIMLAALLASTASFGRGVWLAWRRSKSRTLGYALGWLLICGVLFGIPVWLFMDVQRKARLAADQATVAALRDLIARYAAQQGRFPPDKRTAERLLDPRPPWQCQDQDWLYDPGTGRVTLARNFVNACR